MNFYKNTLVYTEEEFEKICCYYKNKQSTEDLHPFFSNQKTVIKNYIFNKLPIKI